MCCFTAAIVQTREEWAVLAVFVFINMCTGMGLQQDEIIKYVVFKQAIAGRARPVRNFRKKFLSVFQNLLVILP